MRELDRVRIAGHEPRRDHPVDELLLHRVDDHLTSWHLAADRLSAGSGDDQSEDQVAQLCTSGLVEGGVQRLGRLRDGAAHAARRLVAGDRQRATLMAQPGLAEGVGQQG